MPDPVEGVSHAPEITSVSVRPSGAIPPKRVATGSHGLHGRSGTGEKKRSPHVNMRMNHAHARKMQNSGKTGPVVGKS